jgi:DNA mismatch repair ATPase MutS
LIYVFYILIIVLIIVIWSAVAEEKNKKQLKIQLRDQWGQIPEREYSSEKMEYLLSYYNSIKDEQHDIDDITWNDLDMDEIYALMNNTQCSIGEEYLYALLHKPCFDPEELEERNRLMKYFSENEEQRLMLQTSLNNIGRSTRISIYEYINRLGEQKTGKNIWHYLMILSIFASIGLIFVAPALGSILTIASIANNIFQYYKVKSQIENYLIIFSYILRLLDCIKNIFKLNIPEIKEYSVLLRQDYDIFKKFKRGSVMLTPSKPSGSLTDMALDYARMLFHIDLIKYNSMLDFFKNNRHVLNRMFTNIGFLDSMIAAASFRELIIYYCEPVLEKSKRPFIQVNDLYHPLIEEPVPNSIQESNSVLITGSNASGKSTFIKTLAINSILAQTIFTSISRSYKASYFRIYSSMALKDNIFNKESYYMVEIKSLKRILDRINDDIPLLCFIDEVLRGTNTLERVAASSRILSYLSKKNTLVFAATHDIELTHILENQYSNYHFQERIEANEIIFDYKIYNGKAISKNAIKLLNMLKFPGDITLAAESAAEEFLKRGEWSKIV